jgi:hypothetical protein
MVAIACTGITTLKDSCRVCSQVPALLQRFFLVGDQARTPRNIYRIILFLKLYTVQEQPDLNRNICAAAARTKRSPKSDTIGQTRLRTLF